jgi:phenylacetate-CoA ligase
MRIANTLENTWMFTVLWQRQARWFRLDPHGRFCDVRIGCEIGRQPDGTPNPDGALQRFSCWRYLGSVFDTGPAFGFNNSAAVEQQLAWLQELRPDYVMSYPGSFEELALANHGRIPVDSLRGLIAISTMLTPSLRRRLQDIYGVPIHQTYGLNEIGKVAVRCEAGRYHVHMEHCIVEIVDADGQPCRPGETGRVLVTALRNFAMPLFRYDTGDLAEAVAGPCPCGRTLPSFGEIAGRFRRYQGLPAGTRQRVNALLDAFSNVPADAFEFLREYQLHQDRENRFTLRLRTAGPVPGVFTVVMQRVWATVAGDPPAPLEIRTVEHIPRSTSGKQLDFVSDFYEDDYAPSNPRDG